MAEYRGGGPSREDFGRAFWRSAPKLAAKASILLSGELDAETARLVAEALPAPCWIANGDGHIVWYNRRWHEYCGTTPEQMEGWGWQAVHDPERLPDVLERWRRAIASGEPFEMTFPLRGADGLYRPFLTRIVPVRDAAGAVVRWVGLNIEVSDLLETEADLRSSEDRLRLATEAADIGTWDLNPTTGELRWDDRCRALFGVPPGAPVDYDTFLAGVHPEDREATDRAVQWALAPDGPGGYDVEYRTVGLQDRKLRWIAAKGRGHFVGEGAERRAIRFVGTVVDISQRKLAEIERDAVLAALRDETHALETLNRTAAAISGELDLERLVQMVTDAGRELTGAAFGAYFYNVLNEAGESYMLYTLSGAEREDFERFGMPRNTAIFDPTFSGEGVVRSADITLDPRYGRNAPHMGMPAGHLPVRSYLAAPVTSRTGEVIGGLFFGHPEPAVFQPRHERMLAGLTAQAAVAMDNARLYRDQQRTLEERRRAEERLRELNETLEQRVAAEVAERLRAEAALRQAQKMEAVGQLTGGVAHDFNNMLAVVIGSLDLARRRLESGAAGAERYIDNAHEGASRAAALTQRLLAFSRQQPLSPRVLNLNRLVQDMSELLRRTLGGPIELETILAGGLWRVSVDPHQLESALVNLALNARDAMPDGGRLTIETANAHLDDAYAAANLGVAAGQYAMLAITDRGHGMTPDVVAQAFDPFFTTKPVGKGTGLGLSMVYGFVKQSGGHVAIYSEPDEGTTVKIYLPRHVGAADERPLAKAPARLPDSPGGEVVLVVEDEERVRTMSVAALTDLGYIVHQAGGGPEALELIERLPRLDLLFTDVVMAGMSGRELATRVQAKAPHVKVLFTTGYTRNAVVHNGIVDPDVEFISKPFSIADLAAKVRDVLDS